MKSAKTKDLRNLKPGEIETKLTDAREELMKLRETESSKYTQRDTPIFTCVQMPMERILDQLF